MKIESNLQPYEDGVNWQENDTVIVDKAVKISIEEKSVTLVCRLLHLTDTAIENGVSILECPSTDRFEEIFEIKSDPREIRLYLWAEGDHSSVQGMEIVFDEKSFVFIGIGYYKSPSHKSESDDLLVTTSSEVKSRWHEISNDWVNRSLSLKVEAETFLDVVDAFWGTMLLGKVSN